MRTDLEGFGLVEEEDLRRDGDLIAVLCGHLGVSSGGRHVATLSTEVYGDMRLLVLLEVIGSRELLAADLTGELLARDAALVANVPIECGADLVAAPASRADVNLGHVQQILLLDPR